MKRKYEKVIERCQDCPAFQDYRSYSGDNVNKCPRRNLEVVYAEENFENKLHALTAVRVWFDTCDLPEVKEEAKKGLLGAWLDEYSG